MSGDSQGRYSVPVASQHLVATIWPDLAAGWLSACPSFDWAVLPNTIKLTAELAQGRQIISFLAEVFATASPRLRSVRQSGIPPRRGTKRRR